MDFPILRVLDLDPDAFTVKNGALVLKDEELQNSIKSEPGNENIDVLGYIITKKFVELKKTLKETFPKSVDIDAYIKTLNPLTPGAGQQLMNIAFEELKKYHKIGQKQLITLENMQNTANAAFISAESLLRQAEGNFDKIKHLSKKSASYTAAKNRLEDATHAYKAAERNKNELVNPETRDSIIENAKKKERDKEKERNEGQNIAIQAFIKLIGKAILNFDNFDVAKNVAIALPFSLYAQLPLIIQAFPKIPANTFLKMIDYQKVKLSWVVLELLPQIKETYGALKEEGRQALLQVLQTYKTLFEKSNYKPQEAILEDYNLCKLDLIKTSKGRMDIPLTVLEIESKLYGLKKFTELLAKAKGLPLEVSIDDEKAIKVALTHFVEQLKTAPAQQQTSMVAEFDNTKLGLIALSAGKPNAILEIIKTESNIKGLQSAMELLQKAQKISRVVINQEMAIKIILDDFEIKYKNTQMAFVKNLLELQQAKVTHKSPEEVRKIISNLEEKRTALIALQTEIHTATPVFSSLAKSDEVRRFHGMVYKADEDVREIVDKGMKRVHQIEQALPPLPPLPPLSPSSEAAAAPIVTPSLDLPPVILTSLPPLPPLTTELQSLTRAQQDATNVNRPSTEPSAPPPSPAQTVPHPAPLVFMSKRPAAAKSSDAALKPEADKPETDKPRPQGS